MLNVRPEKQNGPVDMDQLEHATELEIAELDDKDLEGVSGGVSAPADANGRKCAEANGICLK